MSFTITWRHDPDAIHLTLAGEIDLAVAEDLRHTILNAIADTAVANAYAAGVIIDLGEVTFLDSTGIAALVDGHNKAQETGAAYRVTNPRGIVRKALLVTGLLPTLLAAASASPEPTGTTTTSAAHRHDDSRGSPRSAIHDLES